MLNEASLDRLRQKLLAGPAWVLTPQERAFLASLIANHVTAIQANELYLTPEPRASITQPMTPMDLTRAGFRALPTPDATPDATDHPTLDDFPQSSR